MKELFTRLERRLLGVIQWGKSLKRLKTVKLSYSCGTEMCLGMFVEL